MLSILSSIGSVLGLVLGGTNNNDQTIEQLKEQVAQLTKSVNTYKTITYILGFGLLLSVIALLRKK